MIQQTGLPSPAARDLGPVPELWEPLRQFGDALHNNAPSNGGRVVFLIPNVFQYKVPSHPTEHQSLTTSLVEAVQTYDPLVQSLQVHRHILPGNGEVRFWHTDTRLANPTIQEEAWVFDVVSFFRGARLMSLNRPSTLVATGTILEDVDKLKEFHHVSAPPGLTKEAANKLGPRLIDEALNQADSTYVGSDGQIVRLRDPNGTPQGDPDIWSVPQGNLLQLNEHTLHRPPRGIPAGGTLLYLM